MIKNHLSVLLPSFETMNIPVFDIACDVISYLFIVFILYSNKIDMGPVCDHVDKNSLGQIEQQMMATTNKTQFD